MKRKSHIYFFCLATTLWTIFFLEGLWSNYYLEWPWYWQLIFVDLTPIAILIYRVPYLISEVSEAKALNAALWLAFYFSIPLLIYEFIYFHLFKDLPLSYLVDYWYLTAFSVAPWIIFPLISTGLPKIDR